MVTDNAKSQETPVSVAQPSNSRKIAIPDTSADGVSHQTAYHSGTEHGRSLHLDPECHTLSNSPVEKADLSTIPESQRKWCDSCGPDADETQPPQDGADVCQRCGRNVAAFLIEDGECIGCRLDDDGPDARLVTDGGQDPLAEYGTDVVVTAVQAIEAHGQQATAKTVRDVIEADDESLHDAAETVLGGVDE